MKAGLVAFFGALLGGATLAAQSSNQSNFGVEGMEHMGPQVTARSPRLDRGLFRVRFRCVHSI
jgi:hypothetical protein